jgi:hypothetical protein
MSCVVCKKQGTGCPSTFAFIEYDLAINEENRNESEEPTSDLLPSYLEKKLVPMVTFGFHGDDFDENDPYYKLTCMNVIDPDHPDVQPSHISRLCGTVHFCSFDCMRTWLNMQVDILEKAIEGYREERDPAG